MAQSLNIRAVRALRDLLFPSHLYMNRQEPGWIEELLQRPGTLEAAMPRMRSISARLEQDASAGGSPEAFHPARPGILR